MLTIAYALHSMLEEDTHSLFYPNFYHVCYNETVHVWPDGELLLKYIAKVRCITKFSNLTLRWPMATKVPLIKFAKRTPNQVSKLVPHDMG